MLGELRGAATQLCALLLTLAIMLPSAQSLANATVVLLVAVAIASVAARHVPAPPTVSVAPSLQRAWTRAPRLCCPVLVPDDPACPRAPGIG